MSEKKRIRWDRFVLFALFFAGALMFLPGVMDYFLKPSHREFRDEELKLMVLASEGITKFPMVGKAVEYRMYGTLQMAIVLDNGSELDVMAPAAIDQVGLNVYHVSAWQKGKNVEGYCLETEGRRYHRCFPVDRYARL